jgi:hypothetical protein
MSDTTLRRSGLRSSAAFLTALGASALTAGDAAALVRFDEGRLTIDGVQLLQTVEDPNAYEYLAGDLTLARNSAGDLQLLMAKYTGGEGTTGGILHALVEFGLSPERRADIEEKLQELRPGAVLLGPVHMTPVEDDGRDNGSFQIVSASLAPSESPGDRIAGQVLHSGTAPFTPGSEAALAAQLSPEAATLMWDSLTGSTADLSVAVRGYYEALVEGYNAIVRADVATIYQHQSFIDSFQKGFTKRQVRDIADELIQSQTISVEVFDRSEGAGIESGDMQKIVDLVTDKLIDLVFDRETGWSKAPPPEAAVEQGQICGRQERGFFSKLFSGATDDAYCTDDQYVIKDIENVASRSFVLNLSKQTTVRVPFDTAGNLGGFYDDLPPEERDRYFKVIDLADTAFQELDVAFQLDSGIVEAFKDKLTLVSVNLSRERPDGSMQSEALVFDRASVTAGKTMQQVNFKRLGDASDDWREFRYQVAWNVSGLDEPLRVPAAADEFLVTRDAGIQLTPPLESQRLTLDVDNGDFEAKGIRAVLVQFAAKVGGRPQFVASKTIRAGDADPSGDVRILKDPGERVVIRQVWYTRDGRIDTGFRSVDEDYVFLFADDALFEDLGGGN